MHISRDVLQIIFLSLEPFYNLEHTEGKFEFVLFGVERVDK